MLDWLFGKSERAARERVEPSIGNVVDGDTVVSSDRIKMGELFAPVSTPSGAVVNDATAMRVSAVYACVRLIAGAIAGLPVHVYRRTPEARQRIDHDLWWLLNEQPCAAFNAATFWEFIATQFMLREDGIAFIKRTPNGAPEAFIPWPRSKVRIDVDPESPPKNPRLVYRFHDGDRYFGAEQDDVLHFPGFGFNGVHGMSVIQWGARNGIGIAIKADEFAGKFYGQGAQPQHAIKAPGQMTPAQQDAFREAWVAKYSGAGPTGMPLILTEGLDITELSMTAADAQLLESRKWQVIDIARAFGVPPFMIGENEKSTSWGSGIEQMGIGFARYTLMPHLTRIRQELNRKLFRRAGLFVAHNVDSLQQADAKGRGEYFKAALGGTQSPAWMTPNEVRKLENLPPIDGGDQLSKPEPKGSKPPEGEP